MPHVDSSAPPSASFLLESVVELWAGLRARSPRVHCMTNAVAQAYTANLLLAAGAVPSMTIAPDEVGDFVARSDALLLNVGTLDATLRAAIPPAIAAAKRHERPFAFDPVLVDRSDPRLALAREVVAAGPTLMRANALEFEALAGQAAEDGSVRDYAARHTLVVAVTGAVDRVTDGTSLVRIANGHPLMARVTAVGCAGTALTAGFLALAPSPLIGAVAGLVILGIAGEKAAAMAPRPGSYAIALLDALDALGPKDIVEHARLEVEP